MFSYILTGEPPSQNGVNPQSISNIRIPRDHLVNSSVPNLGHSICNVPIDRLVVTFARHYFWSEVVWCAAERPGDVRHIFGKAEIGNLDMAVSVEK